MTVAVVGSRSAKRSDIYDFGNYLPEGTTEIIAGGVKSEITALAREYALSHGIKYTEFLPNRTKYKHNALKECYIDMINNAQSVITPWYRESPETKFVEKMCRSMHISLCEYMITRMRNDARQHIIFWRSIQ